MTPEQLLQHIKAFILACKLYGNHIGYDEDENPVYIEWESAWQKAKQIHLTKTNKHEKRRGKNKSCS